MKKYHFTTSCLVFLSAFLSSCVEKDAPIMRQQPKDLLPRGQLNEVEISSNSVGRFETSEHARFKSSPWSQVMYYSIYVIKDNNTDVEYMAVEGCGIAVLKNKDD